MWQDYCGGCGVAWAYCLCGEQDPIRCDICREGLPGGEAVELDGMTLCRSCRADELEASREEATSHG